MIVQFDAESAAGTFWILMAVIGVTACIEWLCELPSKLRAPKSKQTISATTRATYMCRRPMEEHTTVPCADCREITTPDS